MTYKEYSYQYVVLIAFSLGTAINGTCWLSGTPIHDEMQRAYNVSDTFLTFCGLVFMLTYVFFGFGANYIIQKYGLRIGVRLLLILYRS
jgi:fucose permease